ncbi:MAG: PKD domain-containing protein [Bacteroidota bacterium]|nr:PKD domain-containing protein [Bacteroidota bacterium]
MTRIFFSLLILLIINNVSTAQVRNLFVNSSNNIVKLNFATAKSAISYTGINNGFEAIAHAEDGLGNILFFVNADGIYNKLNVLMPGSENIYANSSSSEIDICPFPNDPNKFYVFYNAEFCSTLYYSVVDMKLEDGLGAVVKLNIVIDTANVAEGLEIIKRPCRNSYWLLAYACEIGFKKYLIDEKGISPGTIMYEYSGPEIFLGRGEMDYHNGKMGISFSNNPTSTAFVCDLDAYTGIIDNPKTITLPGGGNGLYGMEFSPDGSKVYMTNWYENKKNNFFQYDFATEKIKSYYITSTPADTAVRVTGPGQIELGADGKLYIPFDKGNQITVVKNPNSSKPEFSKITTKSSLALGVSDHIQSEIYKTKNNFTYKNVCLKETTNFIFESAGCSGRHPNVVWDFGDKGAAKKNTSTKLDPSHFFKVPGEYRVNLYVTDSAGNDTISHTVTISSYPKVKLGNDTSICRDQSIVLNAHNNGMNYKWSTSEYEQKINVSQVGKYWVNVTNKGCSGSDTILVKHLPTPNVNIGEDLLLCDGIVQTLNCGSGLVSCFWSTGENTKSIKIASGGTYWVKVSNSLCSSTDTVDITFEPSPKVFLGNDITLCGKDSTVLNAANAGATYLWSTGDTSPTLKVNKTGMYYVTVNNGICAATDTIHIINRGFIPIIKVPQKVKFSSNLDIPILKITTQNVNDYHIKIVNSLGKVVYESYDCNKDWDGKAADFKRVDDGIYKYTIEYNTPCSTKTSTEKGSFTLSR